MAIGCVVTIDEDRRLNRGMKQKMPPAFDTVGDPLHQDPWARYRRAGVAWVGPIVWRDGAPVLDGSSVTKRG
jgi:hypothetical protein